MCMTHLSMKKGLKYFGKDSENAVTEELKQLHMCDSFKPINPSNLSKSEKAKILESHLFLKQKRDSTIKGRLVGGGNKQRDYVSKNDVSSPTATLESVFLVSTIAAKKNRKVATVDIPNAFFQTEIPSDEKIRMRLRGKIGLWDRT